LAANIPGLTPNQIGSSGTFDYIPTGSEMVLEAFSRIQMWGTELEVRHVVEARRSLNLMLSRLPNNSKSLWLIGDEPMMVPLTPGVPVYQLPTNVVDIVDAWRRIYTRGTTTSFMVGNTLTPMTAGGIVMVNAHGEPMTVGPGSGTLSCIAGRSEITMHWPAHGLELSAPLFWNVPVSIGGLVLDYFNAVDTVIDQDTIQFHAVAPAQWTSTGQGATPLYQAFQGSSIVSVMLPNHDQVIGDIWTVNVTTVIGASGLTLPAGEYYVFDIVSDNEFQINPLIGVAAVNDCAFENGGQLSISTQQEGIDYVDIFLWPISRGDYAALPDKQTPGPPTQYWFNRTVNPLLTLWPVPRQDEYIAFVAYRMRKVMDFDPDSGETPDLPSRLFDWGCTELCARMAEKFKPEQHQIKLALAKVAWEEAASEDREQVSTFIAGIMEGYFS
jgi:hypothetical protein